MTTSPARILGVEGFVGRIVAGQLANLVVVEGGLFEEDAKIRTVFVEGHPHVISRKKHDIDGRWRLALALDKRTTIDISVDGESVKLLAGEERIDAKKVERRDRHLTFLVDGETFGLKGQVAIGGHVDQSIGDAGVGRHHDVETLVDALRQIIAVIRGSLMQGVDQIVFFLQ